jgi:hypothetical protein
VRLRRRKAKLKELAMRKSQNTLETIGHDRDRRRQEHVPFACARGLRLGIAPCVELLMDLPTYFVAVRRPASLGYSDIAPAIKWQISPVPGKVDPSAIFGVALPTGTTDIASPGAQPYVQFPWSWELHHG